jgi:hypothetical protein
MGTHWYAYQRDHISTLNKLKDLKFGQLMQCKLCQAYWFVESDQGLMDRVYPEDFPAIEAWNWLQLQPDGDQEKALEEIGATPPDIYGGLQDYIRIPCSCTLKSGEARDLCILRFQKRPPLTVLKREREGYVLLNEVEKIFSSPFALRRAPRYASTQAEELSYGYSPTSVKAPNGQDYVLNGTIDFFYTDGIKGSELQLISKEEERKKKNYGKGIDGLINQKMTIIIADWDDKYLTYRIEDPDP